MMQRGQRPVAAEAAEEEMSRVVVAVPVVVVVEVEVEVELGLVSS